MLSPTKIMATGIRIMLQSLIFAQNSEEVWGLNS
jgi:hypothetical protein